MIHIAVSVDGREIVRNARVTGHAIGIQKGGNIVCAAVTVLVRTAARLLENRQGVRVSGGPGERGEFSLEVESIEQGAVEFVRATGDFLLQGIRDLQTEFPEDCTLTVMQRR